MENLAQIEQFSFNKPVEAYIAKRGRQGRGVEFRRFPSGAEAIRFLMEDIEPEILAGSVIESDAGRFDASLIRRLYNSPSYPLAVAVRPADAKASVVH